MSGDLKAEPQSMKSVSSGWLTVFSIELPLSIVTALVWVLAPEQHLLPILGLTSLSESDRYLLLLQAIMVSAVYGFFYYQLLAIVKKSGGGYGLFRQFQIAALISDALLLLIWWYYRAVFANGSVALVCVQCGMATLWALIRVYFLATHPADAASVSAPAATCVNRPFGKFWVWFLKADIAYAGFITLALALAGGAGGLMPAFVHAMTNGVDGMHVSMIAAMTGTIQVLFARRVVRAVVRSNDVASHRVLYALQSALLFADVASLFVSSVYPYHLPFTVVSVVFIVLRVLFLTTAKIDALEYADVQSL